VEIYSFFCHSIKFTKFLRIEAIKFCTIDSLISIRMKLTRREFETLVLAELDTLPKAFQQAMANIAIVIADWPDRATMREFGVRRRDELFGAYLGTPLPERDADYGNTLPDKICVYQRPLENFCSTLEELREQVRITLRHEIGHYFGLDEDRLAELGYQ
jgi:predicted Zn-dependent protease with MMP-like domain